MPQNVKQSIVQGGDTDYLVLQIARQTPDALLLPPLGAKWPLTFPARLPPPASAVGLATAGPMPSNIVIGYGSGVAASCLGATSGPMVTTTPEFNSCRE